MDYDVLLAELEAAGNSMRCSDLCELLAAAGFHIRKGKRGNHHVFTHPGLPSFTSSSFDCGHGANPTVKKPYLTKIKNKVIKMYDDELKEFLEAK